MGAIAAKPEDLLSFSDAAKLEPADRTNPWAVFAKGQHNYEPDMNTLEHSKTHWISQHYESGWYFIFVLGVAELSAFHM